jgi:hypothetical protein
LCIGKLLQGAFSNSCNLFSFFAISAIETFRGALPRNGLTLVREREQIENTRGRSAMAKTHDQLADELIAEFEGNTRDALIATLKINYALMQELRQMTGKRVHERHPLATQ